MRYIGRYRIRGLLGRGGMGKVYKVELPAIGKLAALKLFAPDELLAKLMGRNRLRDLFIREATTIARLRHPYVVNIHDYDELDGAPFFVMDYFADNLGALIGEHYEIEQDTRPLIVERALTYARQTLDGLACLHNAGIVHRDIKPFNLLLTPWNSVQICDFGLSKLRGEVFQGPANLNVGSPYYAAPEQEQDPDTAVIASDLYSVGVTLYRMLTGKLPYVHGAQDSCTPLSDLHPDLDVYWNDWMERAIAYRPEDRFASAVDMRHALDRLTERWEEHRENVCSFPEAPLSRSTPAFPMQKVRTEPLKLSPREAGQHFNLDRLWRPHHYRSGAFQPGLGGGADDGLIADETAGLIWQQSGSPYPLTWPQAKDYIRDLNKVRFAGRGDWRLPTIDELLSLLRPPPIGEELCMALLFDTTQRRLWSIDRRSYTAAYYVDCELGFVGWQDFSAPFHVRGVYSGF